MPCSKRAYGDKKAAKRSAKKQGKTLHVYECPHCGYWHLTSQSETARRAHAERAQHDTP